MVLTFFSDNTQTAARLPVQAAYTGSSFLSFLFLPGNTQLVARPVTMKTLHLSISPASGSCGLNSGMALLGLLSSSTNVCLCRRYFAC